MSSGHRLLVSLLLFGLISLSLQVAAAPSPAPSPLKVTLKQATRDQIINKKRGTGTPSARPSSMPKPSGRPAAGPQQVSQDDTKREFHLYYTGSGYVIHPDTMSAVPAPLTQIYSSNTDQHSAVIACSKFAIAQTVSYPSFQLYKDTTNDQWNCTIFAPTHAGGPSKADFSLIDANATSVLGYTQMPAGSHETRRSAISQSTEFTLSPAVSDYCSTYPQYCQACLENPSACSYCAENPSARICTGGSRRKRRGMVWEKDVPKEVLMELVVMGELGIGRL